MDGRRLFFISARQATLVGLVALLAAAISSRALADDPAALRPLARRYYSPTRMFQNGENDVQIDRFVAQTAFTLPVEAPPPIAMQMDEPAVFNEAPAPPPVPMTVVAPESLEIGMTSLAVAGQNTPPPAPGVNASDAPTSQPGSDGSFEQVQKLGDAPPSTTLQFLRRQDVVLKPGQHQVDWGLTYSVLDERFANLSVSGTTLFFSNDRERLQLVTVPFAFRYGIAEGLQGYINAPLGWSNTQLTSDAGDSVTSNFGGIGDVSAGLSYRLCKGEGYYKPDIITTLGFVAPTGHATFNTSLLAPNSALGQGFWQITTNVLAIHTIDPLVIYYGGGYVHRFDATISGLNVQGGQEFDYMMGVGFAVNPWTTLSWSVIGAYLTRFGVNDVSIPGSDLSVARFRFSVTVVKGTHIWEPFAEVAMTQDSPSRVGMVFTY